MNKLSITHVPFILQYGLKLLLIKLITIFFLTANVNAQSLIKESFKYTAADSIRVNIWLPYEYNKEDSYPVIYFNSYGSLDQFGLNVSATMNTKNASFPKAIVVEILPVGSLTTTEVVGYDYLNKNINQNGQLFLTTLKDTIFPYINATYSNSTFSIYLGHSYTASYGIQLLYDYPSLFDAYILFAPEILDSNYAVPQPNTSALKNKFMYIFTGTNDIERRINLNGDLVKVLSGHKGIDFKGELIDGAGHNDIVELSLQKGFSDLFNNYFNINNIDSTDLKNSFNAEIVRVKDVFKLKHVNLNRYYFPLYNLAEKYKDREFLNFLLETEGNLSNSPIHLFNIGYIYLKTFKDIKTAEELYLKSINTAINIGKPKEAFNGYIWLSKLYMDDNPDRAFELLVEGAEKCGSDFLLYNAANLALKNGGLKSKGIKILDELLNQPINMSLYQFGITEEKIIEIRDKIKNQ